MAAGEDAAWPFDFQAELLQGQNALGAGFLRLDGHWPADIAPGGGQASAFAGRVKVLFPAASVTQALHVEIRPPHSGEPGTGFHSLGGAPFEVLAFAEGQPVRQFPVPLSIEVTYDESRLAVPESALALFYYDESWNEWVPLLTQLEADGNRLIAQSDHLTLFDYDAQNWEAARLPSLQGFQVASYTGAATYSFPISVPPGPGGLQPGLALSYSSATVDGSTSRTQSSWVGMGWSFDTGYIQRSQNGTPDYEGDDTFSIQASGVGGMLLRISGDQYYHTADESFWRVKYDSGTDAWTAWDKSGTVYTFEKVARYPQYNICSGYTWKTWYWGLTKVRNIFGKELLFTYATESKATVDRCGGYQVTTDWLNTNASRVFFQRSRLSEIQVLNNADGIVTGGSVFTDYELLVRKYVLVYDDGVIYPSLYWPVTNGQTPTLVEIREYGLNGAGPLPSTTFTYGDSMHLTRADNGYGGYIAFYYSAWYDTDSAHRLLKYDNGQNTFVLESVKEE